MTLQSRLHPIASVSCGPTAVCAVTGVTSDRAVETMMRAIDFDGPRPSDLSDFAFRHQVRAVQMLGFDVFNVDGSPFDTSAAPMDRKADLATYDAALTIFDFVTSNHQVDVVICLAARHSPVESHTFAADGNRFFDNNTGGQVVYASGIHSQVRDMKVIEVLRVRPRVQGAVSS